MIVTVSFPESLVERGWSARFANPGAGAFSLTPGESKPVVLRLVPGGNFTAKDVTKAGRDATIHVLARANGILVGGMSYTLDPKLRRPTTRPRVAGKPRGPRAPKA